jgi:hypothetical protein
MTSKQDYMAMKQYGDRQARRRLEGLWWAVVLIWAGLVFAADQMELVPQIADATTWSWIFLGAGVLGIVGSFYRLTASDVPNPTTWDWVWGGICLIIGLDGFVTLTIFWPLILILVGGLSLINALWGRD